MRWTDLRKNIYFVKLIRVIGLTRKERPIKEEEFTSRFESSHLHNCKEINLKKFSEESEKRKSNPNKPKKWTNPRIHLPAREGH